MLCVPFTVRHDAFALAVERVVESLPEVRKPDSCSCVVNPFAQSGLSGAMLCQEMTKKHFEEGQRTNTWTDRIKTHPWGPRTPRSSALRNPQGVSGSSPPSGSPIVGSRASSYRSYCSQLAFLQGALPRAATAVDAFYVKLADEDAYLSCSMTIKANSKTVKNVSD